MSCRIPARKWPIVSENVGRVRLSVDTPHTSSVRCILSGLSSSEGCLDMQSVVLCLTLGMWIILNLYQRVFFLRLRSLGFGMSSRDHSLAKQAGLDLSNIWTPVWI